MKTCKKVPSKIPKEDFMYLWLGIFYSLLLRGFFTAICWKKVETRLLDVTRLQMRGLKFSLDMVGSDSFT